MPGSHVSTLALLDPSCHIEVGLRTEEQQQSCIAIENKVQGVVIGIGVLALFFYARSNLPDSEIVEDQYGRPVRVLKKRPDGSIPQNDNNRRGFIVAGIGAGLGWLYMYLTKRLRMAQWRAEKAAVQAAATYPKDANYVWERARTEALQKSSDAAKLAAHLALSSRLSGAYRPTTMSP